MPLLEKVEDPQLLTFDSETTGLDPKLGAVMLTFAALHESGNSFTVTIQPTDEEWTNAHPKALQVNGITWEDVQGGIPVIEAGDMFTSWMIKHDYSGKHILLAGQNPGFDMKFMWYHWRDGLKFIGFPTKASHVLDAQTMYLIWEQATNNKTMPKTTRTSLKNICINIGIEPEPEPHDALQGANAVMRAIQKMSCDIDRITLL